MPIEGVDYSYARPAPSCLYDAGKRFACRYLSYNTTGKNLTKSEADALSAAGIAVVSNWENAAGDAKGGYDAGVQYGYAADRQAAACGAPAGRPIYFSVDFDTRGASDKTIEAVRQYFAGVRSVIGKARTGIYGGYDTIMMAANEGWAAYYWQTYAWSGGHWAAVAHLRQYKNGVKVCGGDTDLDQAMTADYGQWGVDDVTAADVWNYQIVNPSSSAKMDAGDRLIDTETLAGEAKTAALAAQAAAEGAMAAAVAAQTASEAVLAMLQQGVPVAAEVTVSDESVREIAEAVADEGAQRQVE